MNPLLGWIPTADRSAQLEAQHQLIVSMMPKFNAFNLPTPQLAKGDKLDLTSFWKNPDVVSEAKVTFRRFHQLTGSCVGAGGGQALFSLISVQRKLTAKNPTPTKAFLPFWPYNYGRCRAIGGFNGRGEGSLGSLLAKQLIGEGVLDANDPNKNFPKFNDGGDDGLTLTSKLELDWSDGNSNLVTQHTAEAKKFPLGVAAPLRSAQDIKASLLNGYPCTFACSRYIGNGSLKGSGDSQGVFGKWDSNGGHQQSYHAYWENPDLGPSYLALNNWPTSVYPTHPNQPPCSTWVLEKDVDAAFNYDSECYAFGHLNWLLAQPDIIDFFV